MKFRTGWLDAHIGKVVGRWRITGWEWGLRRSGQRERFATVVCRCGTACTMIVDNIRSGDSKSCGCLIQDRKHGMCRTRVHMAWVSMRQRCENPKTSEYKNYGGRGISVCRRWQSFENFLKDMGQPPSGMSLDRYPDYDGNYEPGNCRWATPKMQNNNLRNNTRLRLNGETKTIHEWADITGIRVGTLRSRVTHGWTVKRALTEPTNAVGRYVGKVARVMDEPLHRKGKRK